MSAPVVECIRCPMCEQIGAVDDFDDHVRDEHVSTDRYVDGYGCTECGEVYELEDEAVECCVTDEPVAR